MIKEILAQIFSGIALAFVVTSYFTNKKYYLLFQSLCIIGLVLSYFLRSEFFAMVGLFIGLFRALTFFFYEKKGKDAPLFLSFIFAGLTLASYFILNLCILKTARPLDILYLTSLVFYTFTFRIRNLTVMRYLLILPLSTSVLFGVFSNVTTFVLLTYVFELVADLVAIGKALVISKLQKTKEKNEI